MVEGVSDGQPIEATKTVRYPKWPYQYDCEVVWVHQLPVVAVVKMFIPTFPHKEKMYFAHCPRPASQPGGDKCTIHGASFITRCIWQVMFI